MKARSFQATLLSLATALLLIWAGVGQNPALSQGCEDPGYAEDHIIVKMKDDASEEAIQRMKDVNGAGEEHEFSANTWTVDLPAGYTVPEAVELYEQDPDVEYAEPDYYLYPAQHCPESGAALRTTISDSPDPVVKGEKLTYTISIRNDGSDTAANVRMTTRAPEGARFVSASFINGAERGSCSPNEVCEVGDVGVDETATITMVARPMRVGYITYVTYPATADNGPEIVVEINERTAVLAPERCTIAGTEGDDYLVGAKGRDVICGFGGGDEIHGKKGGDIILGGDGDDTIAGDSGKDVLRGGDGDDTLNARDGVRQRRGQRRPRQGPHLGRFRRSSTK
ncbi:MAG: S8 family serine peptidase [Rubrobacteraceae bacterium]